MEVAVALLLPKLREQDDERALAPERTRYSVAMSTLYDLVTPESIVLDVEAADWRAAIRMAGDLLVSAGVSEDSYTDSMVGNVEEHGPYIVVTPGFAFAHARAADNVHRTGMSWIRLRTPVEFGHAKNDPVTLVAALAAGNESDHMDAMRQLAGLLGSPATRQTLEDAHTPALFHAALAGEPPNTPEAPTKTSESGAETRHSAGTRVTKDHILTVCGNGLGTSLFLKNTLEQVLDRWGWSPYLTVEATDTISARGKSKDADLILTSGEIARTLGDVGIPVKVISNFTSTDEVDAALRDSYDI